MHLFTSKSIFFNTQCICSMRLEGYYRIIIQIDTLRQIIHAHEYSRRFTYGPIGLACDSISFVLITSFYEYLATTWCDISHNDKPGSS